MGALFAILFKTTLSRYDFLSKSGSLAKSKGYFRIIRKRNILVLGASMLLADFAFLAYVTWTISYLSSAFRLDNVSILSVDFYFGIAVGLGGIGIIISGILYDRIGGKLTSILSGSFAGLFTLLLYEANTLLEAVLFLFIVGFFSNWFWGVLSAMAQSQVESESRPTAISFVQSIAFVGAVSGPSIAGFLFGNNLASLPLVLTVSVPYFIFTGLILSLYTDSGEGMKLDE